MVDGSISPCCTFHGQCLSLGNIKELGIKDAWNSEPMNNLRNQFIKKKINPICHDCLSSTKIYLKEQE